ncbi:MAG: hypothetical protein QM783_14175 [Phycisphaerales bacterium]
MSMMNASPIMLALALCAGIAQAQVTLPGSRQPAAPKPAEAPAPPTVDPTPGTPTKVIPPNFPGDLAPVVGTTKLSDEQLAIEYAGMTMSLPMGAVTLQGANTDGTVYRILAEDRTWTIEVQVRQTSNADSTVHDAADLVMKNVESLAPTLRPGKGDLAPQSGSSVQLLQRLTQFSIAGCPSSGERLYYSAPGVGSRQMMGYTILKPMPTTFVIFQLTCDESNFAKAREAFEVSIATAKFEDPSKAIAARAASLTAGTEFLSHINEAALTRFADDNEHWMRRYAPNAGGSEGTEIGYRIVKVSKGRRSDIGAEGSGGRDNPGGLVVTTQVRLLQRGAGISGKIVGQIDSETKAFSSFDRKDEAWVTTTISRDLKTPGAKPVTYSETGVRSGSSMSIVSRAPGKTDSAVQPTLRSTQYVSAAELPLLGSMLVVDAAAKAKAEAEAAPVELGFYAYRADAGTISLRRETVGRDVKRANAWTVKSRQRDEKSVTTSVFRDDGTLVRAELPDGSVWEPIEPEALLKLWKSKNLPVK